MLVIQLFIFLGQNIRKYNFGKSNAKLLIKPSGKNIKKGDKLTDAMLDDLEKDQWFKLRMTEEVLNEQIDRAEEQLAERRKILDERFEDKRRKLSTGDDLAPGVLKIVKVYLCLFQS